MNPSSNDQPFRSPLALCLFFLTTIVGVGVDLWSKSVAFESLVRTIDKYPDGVVAVTDSREVHFIPGWLHFRATANQGAVFGIGQGKRWLFIVVSVAAIGFLTYLFSSSGRQRLYQLLLGLLLAGVLGNMYDRISLGYVRDMIYALPGWKWPVWIVSKLPDWQFKYQDVFPWIFNIADMLLCCGVFLMIVYSIFHKPAEQEEQVAGSASTPA